MNGCVNLLIILLKILDIKMEKKIAIVSGASKGVGREVASYLAKSGFFVIVG